MSGVAGTIVESSISVGALHEIEFKVIDDVDVVFTESLFDDEEFVVSIHHITTTSATIIVVANIINPILI